MTAFLDFEAFRQGKRVSVMINGERCNIVFMNLITQGASLTKSWDLFLEDGRELYAPVNANNTFFVEDEESEVRNS